jgi:hypothetical protein
MAATRARPERLEGAEQQQAQRRHQSAQNKPRERVAVSKNGERARGERSKNRRDNDDSKHKGLLC